MAERDRNEEPGSTGSPQQNQGSEPTQNTSGQEKQDQNPQNSNQWNNYQTRELSDQGGGEGNATTPRGE